MGIAIIYWRPFRCQMPHEVFSHLMQSSPQSLWGRAQFVNMIMLRDNEPIAHGHTVEIYIEICLQSTCFSHLIIL